MSTSTRQDNKDVSVVIADDHDCVNRILDSILSGHGYNVVGKATDGEEAVDLVRRLAPSVAVLDVMMPGIGGVEVARIVKQDTPATRTMGFSGAVDFYSINAFVDAGAIGFVMKTSPFDEVIVAVESVARGEPYFCSKSSRVLSSGDATAHQIRYKISRLTRREREVLTMICDGMSTQMMAAELGIASRTVEGHRRWLRDKLECRSVAQIIRLASQAGITGYQEPEVCRC